MRQISNSEIQTFKACRRKWWLTYYLGLKPRFEDLSGIKHTGTRVHGVLEKIYAPGGPYIDEALALQAHSVLTASLDHEDPEVTKTIDLENAMVTGYLEWLAETGADEHLRVVEAEQTLTVEILPGVSYVGKIDAQVINQRGARMFIDHKTVAEFTTIQRGLRHNEQVLGYQMLLRKSYGTACDGAIFNMLRRVKRTARAKPPFYQRVEIQHSELELANFEARTINTIADIVRAEEQCGKSINPKVTAQVMYPRPSRDCSWSCSFASVCTMFDDSSRVEEALNAQFDQGDPMDYYKEATE